MKAFGVIPLMRRYPELTPIVVDTLFLETGLAEVLALWSRLGDEPNDWMIEVQLQVSALIYMRVADHHQKEEYRLFLERRIAGFRARGRSSGLGVAYYNYGNFLSRTNPRAALHHYRQAARNEPSNFDRDYYHKEVGGLHFVLGNFNAAAASYKRSLDLNRDTRVLPLYADALMFAGRYRQALMTFREYMRCQHPRPARWDLKAGSLSVIVESLGIGRQRRHPRRADELADVGQDASTEESLARLQSALGADALSGPAWFNSGLTLSRMGDPERAFCCFVTSGLCQTGDLEAWANAFLLSISVHSLSLCRAQAVLETAYFFNGEKFVQTVYDDVKKRGPEFPKQEVMAALDSLVSIIAPKLAKVDSIELKAMADEGQPLHGWRLTAE